MSTPAPVVRRKRPARLQFTSTILLLEAFLVLLVTLVAHGLAAIDEGGPSRAAIWLVGGALMLMLVVLSRLMTWPGGYAAGSVAQVLVLATGIVVPMMFVVGGIFVVMWVVSLRLGGRIDRERAEWAAAHPEDYPEG
ncbi:DUF4233 domain-containing protein [Cellulomonas chengniuliangii]|uniref:DUF4233 domain-containing protein n=1 Tax=Cellulomonas chengniuliangii TaxID=2968084 RepID=A0ABY5KWX8_9CELL|nr:DUF4233 domain-containing protein [Cellulomonas chengniuliangii]MCC2309034.1 DUF4233 domain-containing protein [Cellulomonas chengniuliangii]MCC2319178.1 DUF4233 domain-containing protein [Cellulomonas chengniuliangii]MCC2319327.1 DUF4233 domain-containing protein [Cellulomonas chengniuliangii]UUI74235.1 DUF4233 domain-containing protein [Cellulomonas chengniuliangii]